MKLQAYILRQMLTALLFGVVSIVVLAVPGVAVNAVHKLPAADASLLAAYLLTVLQTLAPYVLPLCFLLAVVGTYGRLAADREWTAIQMAGSTPSAGSCPASPSPPRSRARPGGSRRAGAPTEGRPERADRAPGAHPSNLPPGRTTVEFHGFFLRGAWRDPRDPDIWHDVYMRRAEEEPSDRIDLFADRAHIRTEGGALRVDLDGVRAVAPGAGVRSEQGSVQYAIPLEELVAPRRSSGVRRPRYQTVEELRLQIEQESDPVRRRRLEYEVHKRASLSVVYFLFLLLGAPTGLILRRGNQLAALAISSGYGIGYYALSMNLGAELAGHTDLPVLLVAWGPTALGALASLPLLRAGLRR